MAKRHRLIKKALDSLGWEWTDDSQPLNTQKDIEHVIWEAKDCLNQIEDLRTKQPNTGE